MIFNLVQSPSMLFSLFLLAASVVAVPTNPPYERDEQDDIVSLFRRQGG